jgi:uncharacterized protein involved in outer membrane biogenesis
VFTQLASTITTLNSIAELASTDTATCVVPVQLRASVTVTTYNPAVKPLIVAVLPPLLHKYWYGAVPPLTVTVAPPSVPPKQFTAVELAIRVSPAGAVIVALPVAVQLFASLTVTV